MTFGLYSLSEHESGVSVQRPMVLDVRVTNSVDIDRTVVRVTVGEHGGVTVHVPDGIVVDKLDES